MNVRASDGHTKKYEVAEGVLQGELTSPLLFSLYISDIEDTYKLAEVSGIRGINLNHRFSFHALAYADDMIILADSPTQLQRKLEVLHTYCEKLGLTVNVQKTKILVFHHQHKAILSNTKFIYGQQVVEVVKTFTYLGVTFCTCGKFHEHASAVKVKCAAATKALISIISRSRTHCWKAMMRLKDSMLLSIPLYASEIWGINEAQKIEQVQDSFIRKLLHLPANSPGYLMRMETGNLRTTYHILRRSLCWWTKVQQQNETRLTNICFKELLQLDSKQSMPSRLNWVSRVKQEIMELKIPYVTHQTLPFNWDYLNIGDIVSLHVHKKEQEDIERCENSSYSSFYHRMKSSHSPEKYLSYKLSLQLKRTFCNMRLHADRLQFLNLYISHTSYKFVPTKNCQLCGKGNDDLYHALVECAYYNTIRLEVFNEIRSSLHTHRLFRTYDLDTVKSISTNVKLILTHRHILLGN